MNDSAYHGTALGFIVPPVEPAMIPANTRVTYTGLGPMDQFEVWGKTLMLRDAEGGGFAAYLEIKELP